jgi:hypothetical protein
MTNKKYFFALAALLSFMFACSAVNNIPIPGIGGGGAKNVAELWNDVPKLDGATKSNIEMPTTVSVAISALTGSKFDFVVYKTSLQPTQITDFYSIETMKPLGWKEDSTGCKAAAASTKEGDKGGGFCEFRKTQDGKQSLLVIVMTQNDGSNDTSVFYARAILPPTPSP